MKLTPIITLATLGALVFVVSVVLFAGTAERRVEKTKKQAIGVSNEGSKSISEQGANKIPSKKTMQEKPEPAIPPGMPIYVPPKVGAPGGRVAGGSRGVGLELPSISVLAPDHIGLTVDDQPELYWFLSKPTSYPIEFTFIEDHAVKPILEVRIPCPKTPGIQKIRLSDYGTKLKSGTIYQWFVAIVLDPSARSKDLLSGGLVKYVKEPMELHTKLVHASREKLPYVYAKEGVWYDAVSTISNLIDENPNNSLFRKQRASLLTQVGLNEIAQYETKHCGH